MTTRHALATLLPSIFCPTRLLLFLFLTLTARAASFDAAPFALPLPGGNGLLWEDPREIHRVVVRFSQPPPSPEAVRLEYWGSRWPEQRLPKDREPGGGDVGWMELGNWYAGGWRRADADVAAEGTNLTFTFHPVNAKEFPGVGDFPAKFRYTLKLRVVSDSPLPPVARIETFTDSTVKECAVRLVWDKSPTAPEVTVFNGELKRFQPNEDPALHLLVAANPDPNTFDRTLVTVKSGATRFTFRVDDLDRGELFLPEFGVAVLPATDKRTYAQVASGQAEAKTRTLYDRVAAMPEQSWQHAWSNMPRKKTHIYLPLGLDGGRQRFRLDADGTVRFRFNDHYMTQRPGSDTPRLALEKGPVLLRFGPPREPVFRTLAENCLPLCRTEWETNGIRLSQEAFVAPLAGASESPALAPPDACTVFLARFVLTNTSSAEQTASLPISCTTGEEPKSLRWDERGFLWVKDLVRGQVVAPSAPATDNDRLVFTCKLAPGQSASLVMKVPYLALTNQSERDALAALDFAREQRLTTDGWRGRLDQGARLITPEPMLNEFYRSVAAHLLINCEREPGAARRFARVGSFSYGAYGNESCMMVADLDRRGYEAEARECLDAWLHYQGTVGLPGDFASKQGVLYGAGGYESGGYNQHHGWILWMMAEHYRFSCDRQWLRQAAPGILAAADWIIRETRRTADRHELERGLLPAGSLEDIGDWWTWLSTSCYTWRGLDAAAFALEQIQHPEAARVRAEASRYHESLLGNFRRASERSPVVRLPDGTAVPKIPSHVHRRGRSFGWICETLEGSLHLLITRALPSSDPEAAWILKDYEDNLFLSNQYGYTLPDFDRYWFDRGGMSMQACLLLDVEPYLDRDDVKQALRAMFNAIAVSYFPDERMNTEHALPNMEDWRGDHYKSSDEANACGWLRQIFLREQGDKLLVGQAVPRGWLAPGSTCGLERGGTWFGKASILYKAAGGEITAELEGPTRNPPAQIRVRFRTPDEKPLRAVMVNGKPWTAVNGDWVDLPGNIGRATIQVRP